MKNFEVPVGVVQWMEASPTDTAFGNDQTGQQLGESAEGNLDLAVATIEAAELDVNRNAFRSQVLKFCEDHSDALYRSCLDGHLTGSAFVVDRESRSVLLIHHRKLDRWLQPGGHADGEGNLALVALAEVQEETGLSDLKILLPAFDIDVHAIPARPGEPAHLHLDLRFVVMADRSQDLRLADGEVIDARWFSADDPELLGNDDVNDVAARAIQIVDRLALNNG